MQFESARPQGQGIFLDFMILLDSCYDFRENEVLSVKIGAKILELWVDTSSGRKWPKCSL